MVDADREQRNGCSAATAAHFGRVQEQKARQELPAERSLDFLQWIDGGDLFLDRLKDASAGPPMAMQNGSWRGTAACARWIPPLPVCVD